MVVKMNNKKELSENVFIFTFGYGNRSNYDIFLGYLKDYHVSCVIDVREKPRAWSRKWYGEQIEKLCIEQGIEYISSTYLGNLSGTKEWVSPDPKKAEEVLQNIALKHQTKSVLLLCAEMDYKRCHRTEVANHLKELTHQNIHHLA